MDRIKLIALDIDGTIMDGEYNISPAVQSCIQRAKEKGIKVVLATGRMFRSTLPVAAQLGITTPLITYQGSLIRETTGEGKILLHHTIESDLAMQIIRELRKFNVQINVFDLENLFVESESQALRDYSKKRYVEYKRVDSFDNFSPLVPTKIITIDNDCERITSIQKTLCEKFRGLLNVTKSSSTYCEFINLNATKGNAILHLAKLWGIDRSQIMAIGDHDNDMEMLEAVGVPIAMGNATQGLKSVASYVTQSVEEDGAALAIEKFAL